MFELRDYQKNGRKALYSAIVAGFKRIVWVWPTGAGKSTVCASVVKDATSKGKRVLFLVHSKELVEQFATRLASQFSIGSGIIMAGVEPSPERKVQVASVQTLVRRTPPQADIIFIDETHRATANSYKKILGWYPDAIIIGLTATPFRGDGKGLHSIYDKIVHPVKIKHLISLGHLVGTKVFGPEIDVDLSNIKVVRGDFDSTELSERYAEGSVIQGVVDNYLKNAKGKKAICFNVSVANSKEMCKNFNYAGINAAHLDGTTPKSERASTIQDFKNGKIDVLCNVNLFTEGFDVPDTEVVILNRATKSENLYVQMVGRGLRPSENKSRCIVLDHGSNTERFGFVEDYDERPFELVDRKKKGKREGEAPVRKCPECGEVISIARTDCECGFNFPKQEVELKTGTGVKMMLYEREALIVSRLTNMKYKKALKTLPLSQFRIFALLRGYKKGWWFNQAIDTGLVAVDKEQTDAWNQVKFRIELAELEGQTKDLYEKIKKQLAA